MNDKPDPPFPDQELSPPGIEKRMQTPPQYYAQEYRAANKLKNKTALITGGDSGIGRAVAVMFAREGASVAIVYLPEEQADADDTLAAVESAGASLLQIPGDVCDPSFCGSAVEKTVAQFGQLDILVNNAAYQRHRETVEDVSLEQWQHTFQTNIFAYFSMVQSALPHLAPGSAIINTGSITGLEGSKHLLDYSATKGAIHAFTKSLAKNLVDREIRVNCVAPGPVWTPLNPAERSAQEMRHFGEGTPLGRPAQPEEIAPAYVYFASNADSGYVSGHILPLLGGGTIAG